MWLRTLSSLILLMTLFACAHAEAQTPRPPVLAGLTFVTGDVEGAQDLFATTPITVAFGPAASIRVSAACNSITGSIRPDGVQLTVEAIEITEKLCDPDRQAQDRWLLELFQASPTWQLRDDTLTIRSAVAALRLHRQ
jgi:heat shock protein HslJ